MDFTREPILETVITPKEGCKLVVRSSKSTGQEEYFVDALEVVSFGHSFFFRSMERPKSFLVPATDYEVLEVREARMVLKNVGIDRTIKIAGGREQQPQHRHQQREQQEKAVEPQRQEESVEAEESVAPAAAGERTQEGRVDKKRDRRRHNRRRRGREGAASEEEGQEGDRNRSADSLSVEAGQSPLAQQVATTSMITSLLPPPPTLISETIARYKDNALFKDAFYTKDELSTKQEEDSEDGIPSIALIQPEYGSFEVSEAQEEEIYEQRKKQGHPSDDNSDPFASPTFDENNDSAPSFHPDDKES